VLSGAAQDHGLQPAARQSLPVRTGDPRIEQAIASSSYTSFMVLFARSTEKPAWLDETRAFCKASGIKIAGWGPELLTVEAKSPERAHEVASQLSQLGFRVVKNDDDAYAGLLDLSRNPEAVQAKIASFNISRRRWDEQIEPLIWIACCLLFFVSAISSSPHYPPWLSLTLGVTLAALFCWDAVRIWTWRLDLLAEGLRVRRYARWAMIPWNQIRAIDSSPAKFGRGQVSVTLKLEPHSSEHLGTFVDAFGINLRDRLRYELAQHR